MASFVYEYIQSNDMDKSIQLANDNATLVVQKRGVTTI